MTSGIILCGGSSRRMGTDKAALPFGDETMCERAIRLLSPLTGEIVLVARRDQRVPPGPKVVHDPIEGEGPLAGTVYGLEAITSERAFVAACDTPLLKAEFVARMLEIAEGHEVAVPLARDGRIVPLGAVYSQSVAHLARRLLEAGERRLAELARRAGARLVHPDELADVDPDLDSLLSVNTPEVYRHVLEKAGLTSR